MGAYVRVAGIIAAALLTTGIAQARPASEVVTVQGCGASQGMQDVSFMDPFGKHIEQPPVPPMVMIAYTNAGAKAFKAVEFGVVNDGKVVAVVRDQGHFSPGSEIMHAYGISADRVPKAGRVTCVPLMATYEDGSTWMNPTMPGH
jgi:hypothetical protein